MMLTDPRTLTNQELVRYARSEIDAGSLNTNWHREVVDRLERHTDGLPDDDVASPGQMTHNF